MKLLTTTIGAYPKPSYVTLPDWFSDDAGPDTEHPTEEWAAAIASMGDDAEEILARGTREVIDDQVSCGIDIPAGIARSIRVCTFCDFLVSLHALRRDC